MIPQSDSIFGRRFILRGAIILAGSVVGFASNSDGEKKYTIGEKKYTIAQMKLLPYDQLRALPIDELEPFLVEEEQPSDDDDTEIVERPTIESPKQTRQRPQRRAEAKKKKYVRKCPKTRKSGAQGKYEDIVNLCEIYKTKKAVYDNKLKALDKLYEELNNVKREDVCEKGEIYTQFDKITKFKKGIVEKHEDNPFGVPDMPKLPKDNLTARQYRSLEYDFISPKYKLERAIIKLDFFTNCLNEMKRDLPLAMERSKKSKAGAHGACYGDLDFKVKSLILDKRPRRRLPIIENPEPNSLNGLSMILIVILFLLCAFIVRRFLSRTSVSEAKRSSLTAAEVMV